ncbi:MAG: RNA polymerase sigma factor [Pseudomonadales bacterium]
MTGAAETADGSSLTDAFAAEQRLVQALQAGDHAAFREAVSRYSPQMLARARSIVGPANAEDVVQDTWIAAFRQIGGFEHRAALGTWLLSIVSNTSISLLRKRSKEVSPPRHYDNEPEADWFDASGSWAAPPNVWEANSPEDLLIADALQDCIDKHLLLMSDSQREVLIKRDMQGDSFDSICNELALSASNVRVLLHRGRMRIMKMVDHFQDTGSC